MTRDRGRQERKEGQTEIEKEESSKLGIQAIGSIRLLFWGFQRLGKESIMSSFTFKTMQGKKIKRGVLSGLAWHVYDTSK